MGKQKAVIVVILAFILLFAISSISAEILISQPKAIYNLGDNLDFDIKIDSIKQDYMDIDLNCNSVKQSIYHSVPDSTLFNVNRTLIPAYIGNLSGTCLLSINYDIDSKNSQSFKISKEISVSLDTNNISYNAGENLVVKGGAIMKNGAVSRGFIEISLANISASSTINEGRFSVNLNIPQTLRAGDYILNVWVYDKDVDGNILNEGKMMGSITIKQKPARLDVAVDKQTINPGDIVEIIPFLYDYAGDQYQSQILMRVKDSKEDVLFEGYSAANEKISLNTRTSTAPSLGSIIVQRENITAEKQFFVNEMRRVNATVENKSLFIINDGNVDYDGIIQVFIGNQSILKEISLPIGANKTFELSAPDGTYDVVVKDDGNVYSQSSVALTGGAIDVREVGEKISNIFLHYPIVWLFVIIVIILFGWVSYKKYKTNKKFHFSDNEKDRKKNLDIIKKQGGIDIVNPQEMKNKVDSIILQGDIRKAEQVLSLHGVSNEAAVIAIKLKGNIDGIAKESVRKALEYAYRLKGVSHQTGEFILVIFSPLLTKSKNNEETAIRAATEIDNYLKEHNRKFRRDIINYGVGVNSGDIINKLEKNVLQFSSMGKTLSVAKRIAEGSNQEVLLSRTIHEKTLNSVKVERVENNPMDVFAIKRIIDTEKSQKFINDFMRRN